MPQKTNNSTFTKSSKHVCEVKETKESDSLPLIGQEIWFFEQSRSLSWTQGQVVDVEKNAVRVKIAPSSKDHEGSQVVLLSIKGIKWHPYVLADWKSIADLKQLAPLCEPSILQTLEARYKDGVCYTFAGKTLVALNLFEESEHTRYHQSSMMYIHDQEVLDTPHVYSMAERAYRSLCRDAKNQALIVSGESGAGKTFSARAILEYLAAISQKYCDWKKSDAVIERIVESNPILEAFGNARTVFNNNSSRFGKFITVHYDAQHAMSGASIKVTFCSSSYLLEKSRVCSQNENERNFHVFYTMVSGMDAELFDHLHLEHVQETYLLEPRLSEKARGRWNDMRRSLATLGVDDKLQGSIFRVLAAVLHLGLVGEKHENQGRDQQLSHAAHTLGVVPETMLESLGFKSMTVGQETFTSPVSQEQFVSARFSLAKALYARLFSWLVEHINKSICIHGLHLDSHSPTFIGILDIFGFENCATNCLEQLCINYANERLQAHLVSELLMKEKEEFEKEGLDVQDFSFTNNQQCVSLLDGKLGVFALLDEECQLNRRKSQQMTFCFGDKLHSSLKTHCHYGVPKMGGGFLVRHYAGVVQYSTSRFVSKNNETIVSAHSQLLEGSSDEFISTVLSHMGNEDQSPHKLYQGGHATGPHSLHHGSGASCRRGAASKRQTIVSSFVSSLQELFAVLSETTNYYIRCLVPNSSKSLRTFDHEKVLHQLKSCGVLSCVQASLSNLLYSLTYEEFAHKYRPLIAAILIQNRSTGSVSTPSNGGPKDQVISFIHVLGTFQDMRFGRTKLFFGEEVVARLDREMLVLQGAAAVCIQAWGRMVVQRNRFLALKRSARIVLAVLLRNYLKMKAKRFRAAIVIQNAVKAFLIRARSKNTQIKNPRLQEETVSELSSSHTSPIITSSANPKDGFPSKDIFGGVNSFMLKLEDPLLVLRSSSKQQEYNGHGKGAEGGPSPARYQTDFVVSKAPLVSEPVRFHTKASRILANAHVTQREGPLGLALILF